MLIILVLSYQTNIGYQYFKIIFVLQLLKVLQFLGQMNQLKNRNQSKQTMECFQQWQNTKTYQGHIHRLMQISIKNKTNTKQKKTLLRIKSEPNKLYESMSVPKQHLPLPLVSKRQKRLLSNVIESNSMNLRDKQTLLQNYLLGKRILQTQSVFKSKQVKKQFIFHRMVSKNMNKSMRYNRIAISNQRQKTFTKYEELKHRNTIGRGRICLSFHIKNIIFIKKNLQQNNQTAYNLIFNPHKFAKYVSKALSLKQLTTINHKYLVKRKDFQKEQGIRYQLQYLRGNQNHKMCYFNIKPGDFQKEHHLNENEHHPNEKIFQKLYHPLTNKLMGSIEIQCKINNFSQNNTNSKQFNYN